MSLSKTFGHIPGILPGATFTSRSGLSRAGVHAPTQAGIHGDTDLGAYSICISGGYEDNEDRGDTIIYVGSGGQEGNVQTENQSMEDTANKALWISCQTRRSVRVIRGKNDQSFYAPRSGYRYDGLYYVDLAEMKPGKQGYQMCFFRLRRIMEEGSGPIPTHRLLNEKKLKSMLKRVGKK